MVDAFTPQQRSRVMRLVRGKNTTPERAVRRLAHGLGYRFRLHRADLPGRPDLVFPGRRKVVFVHGCFWHQHRCRRGQRVPQANHAYWAGKLAGNRRRDRRHLRALRRLGWRALVVWECQLRHPARLARRLDAFLAAQP